MNARPVLFFAAAAFGAVALAASPGSAGNFHGGTAPGGGWKNGGWQNNGPGVRPGLWGKNCHGGGGGGGHGRHIVKIWNINKNLNFNKNININKNIVIAKSNSISVAVSGASSGAAGYASSGSYAETTVVNHGGGDVAASAEETCEMQEGSVVKAIHAVCVSSEGREFPASHMLPETWVDTTYEGEVARCIPGSTVKASIGDVTETDQGMAGTYDGGEVLACGRGEALWHYKNGMVKCAPAMPVKDCTERTNLRRYGTGDFFFSYRTKVCASRTAKSKDVDLSSTNWDGGVGDDGN